MSFRLILFFTIPVFWVSLSFGQNSERVSFDNKDSAAGYYLSIRPQSKQIKGVLVLLTSFLAPEALLHETKLHNVASANDLLTIIAPMKQKLYADDEAVDRINTILKDITTRFSADTARFALAGFDEAGSIALRYTEYTYEHPEKYTVQPKAVFGIDTPVDLFSLWRWSENQIKKNYWQGSVGDAKFYLDAMTKGLGDIHSNQEKYKAISPFYKEATTNGNEQYLKNVALRLYYDTDIEWQLKNRRNSYFDTKIPEGSELIKRLLILGNDKAELVAAKQPGMKSSGMRHPNSMSIVDEAECIQWIKRSLDIFDAMGWIAPYTLPVPTGWTTERFSLPPDFAPAITYKGVEELRFAPGWGDMKSEEHWTYCFLWWLDGNPEINAAILQSNLSAYYSGLVARNIPPGKSMPSTAFIKKLKPVGNDIETYGGTIHMFDYHGQQPIILNCLIHVKESNEKNHKAVYFEVSPKPLSHLLWKKMADIGDNVKFK